jgi:DNA-binding transcriptional LysR family regulator
LFRRLEDGSLDLLFFPLPLTGSEFAVARLFREPLLAVAAVDHPIAQLDRVPPERLAGERILTLETGHRLHDQVRRISEQTGAEISLDYGATSLDTIRQMVAMNLGISLLPALYVRSEVSRTRWSRRARSKARSPSGPSAWSGGNVPRAGPTTANWRRQFGRYCGTRRRRSRSSTERFAFSGYMTEGRATPTRLTAGTA